MIYQVPGTPVWGTRSYLTSKSGVSFRVCLRGRDLSNARKCRNSKYRWWCIVKAACRRSRDSTRDRNGTAGFCHPSLILLAPSKGTCKCRHLQPLHGLSVPARILMGMSRLLLTMATCEPFPAHTFHLQSLLLIPSRLDGTLFLSPKIHKSSKWWLRK